MLFSAAVSGSSIGTRSKRAGGWDESGVTRTLSVERILAGAYVWLPLLVVVLLAAPSIGYLLPNYACVLGESYQPLRALRFFQTLGQDFHKYGPMTNLLLAPGYALSLGGWWWSGTFANPSGEFPYGLQQPLEQLSFLIVQGRVIFLLLFVGLFAFLLTSLRAVTSNRLAVALAFSFCVATNYCAVGFAAFTRPDGPMLALVGASLGVYMRILHDGLTLRRGVWLSALAVCAISTKEIAGPVYVLPYLGLLFLAAQEARANPSRRAAVARSVGWMLATGVVAYLVLNVVYAPANWWLRISHWLAGSGADSAVWGGLGSGAMTEAGFAELLAQTFVNNLGPGGTLVTLAALVALALSRPKQAFFSLLPVLSVVALGLVPLGYGSDHFTAVAAVALVPPVAFGLDVLLTRAASGWARPALGAALGLALAVNLAFANFAWIRLEGLFPRVVERALADDPPGDASISLAEVYPEIPGKSRLSWLGYRVDPKSLRQIMDAEPSQRPDRIYLYSGMRGFIEQAKSQPARAQMLIGEGLDVSRWNGVEALGYRLSRTVEPATPAWFRFDWMPAVDLWRRLSPVYVYERSGVDRGPSGG